MFNGQTVTVAVNGQAVTVEQEPSGIIYATSDMKLKDKFGVKQFYANVKQAVEQVGGLKVRHGVIGAGYTCVHTTPVLTVTVRAGKKIQVVSFRDEGQGFTNAQNDALKKLGLDWNQVDSVGVVRGPAV
jgi:hypothetical protein